MESEFEITSLLQEQIGLLNDVSRSLQSIPSKLDDIESCLERATDHGMSTPGDVKSAIDDVTLELTNVTLAIESSS